MYSEAFQGGVCLWSGYEKQSTADLLSSSLVVLIKLELHVLCICTLLVFSLSVWLSELVQQMQR